MEKITLVQGDDWQGLYADGSLLDEGHEITIKQLCDAMGIECEVVTPDQEWLEDRGSLPDDLSEVKSE